MHPEQDLAPGQGVQLDEVEGGNEELKENPASSRNPKDGLPNVSAHGLHDLLQSHVVYSNTASVLLIGNCQFIAVHG